MYIDGRGTKELCDAIIVQASKDYIKAIVNDDIGSIRECESFFLSKWFDAISPLNVDGENLKNRLKRGATEFLKKSIETIDRGFVSKKREPNYRAFNCPLCGGEVYSKIMVQRRNHEKYNDMVIKCDGCELKIKRRVHENNGTVEK